MKHYLFLIPALLMASCGPIEIDNESIPPPIVALGKGSTIQANKPSTFYLIVDFRDFEPEHPVVIKWKITGNPSYHSVTTPDIFETEIEESVTTSWPNPGTQTITITVSSLGNEFAPVDLTSSIEVY